MSSLPLLLVLASALLVATGVSLVVALQAHARDVALKRRIELIDGRNHGLVNTGDRVSITVAQTETTLWNRALLLFGIDLARRAQYKGPWWAIIAVSLGLARLVTWMGGFVVGHLAILATPLLWVFISRRVTSGMVGRYNERMRQQMPDALGMMVRAVRVGVPLAEGIRMVARECPPPTSLNFGQVANELAIGLTLDDALRNMTRQNDIQEYRFLATALSLQAQTGGGLSETLDGLADVMRKRGAARAKGYALAGEARTSAAVLAGLPVVTCGGLGLLNPGYMMRLFTDPLGNEILAGAAVMLGTGIFIMRGLIKKSLS